MKIFDGAILVGPSPKSDVSLPDLADARFLSESLGRLPVDSRRFLEPHGKKISEILKAETDSKQWLLDLRKAYSNFHEAKEDLVLNRVMKAHPEVAQRKYTDLLPTDQLVFSEERFRVVDEILRAKYQDSQSWKDLSEIFKQVKSDLLQVIGSLQLAKRERDWMIHRLESIELRLPFTDPKLLGQSEDCGAMEQNAYYHAGKNIFTVCAGFLNAYQSMSSLYFVVAHELSHAVDLPSWLNLVWREKSKIAQVFSRLQKPDRTIDCGEWKNLKLNALKLPTLYKEKVETSLATLNRCLQKDGPKLGKRNLAEIRKVSEIEARGLLSQFASRYRFLNLVLPRYLHKGKNRENVFFLRPDVFMSVSAGSKDWDWGERNTDVTEIFMQEYLCNLDPTSGANAEKTPSELAFAKAIESTRELVQVYLEDWYSYCGEFCPNLVPYGLSQDSKEAFADWLAARALEIYLEKLKTQDQRRMALGAAGAFLCDMPSVKTESPNFAQIEDVFSIEPHPESRMRRLSLITQKVAGLLNCSPKITSGFSQCKP